MTASPQRGVVLCAIGDLADGEARGFRVPAVDPKIILVRKGARVHAYLDACPHYQPGTPMAWKTNAYLNGNGTRLACHSHGAEFDIETGECVIGPCLGQSLTRVEVEINEEGGVEAILKVHGEENA